MKVFSNKSYAYKISYLESKISYCNNEGKKRNINLLKYLKTRLLNNGGKKTFYEVDFYGFLVVNGKTTSYHLQIEDNDNLHFIESRRVLNGSIRPYDNGNIFTINKSEIDN